MITLFVQAFVMTRHLQLMGREGRVMVIKFGYSNLKTLPTVKLSFVYVDIVDVISFLFPRRFLTISSTPVCIFPNI